MIPDDLSFIEQTLGKYVHDCESQWNVVIEEHAKDITAGLDMFATLIYLCM